MRAVVLLVCVCGSALAADPPEKDAFGDPLPEGALLRLGTVRGPAPITSFGIQKDGTVVSVSDGGAGIELRRWKTDAPSAAAPVLLPLADGSRGSTAQVSADGKYVAGVAKSKLAVWDGATAKPVATFEIESARDFAFAPSGTVLAAATGGDFTRRNADIYLCDVATGKARKTATVAGSFGIALAFSGDGKRLVALSSTELLVLDATSGKQLAKSAAPQRVLPRWALNRDGDLLLTREVESDVLVALDPLTGKPRDSVKLPKGRWAAFTADDKALLVGEAARVVLWDPRDGKELRSFPIAENGKGTSATISARFAPDGKALVGSTGSRLIWWNTETGKRLFAEHDAGHTAAVGSIGVSANGRLFATRGWDHCAIVWDAATGKELWRTDTQPSLATHLDFSPDSKFVYTVGPKANEVTQRDAATGKAVRAFAAPLPNGGRGEPRIERARLAPDGKTLFTSVHDASRQKRAQIGWDTTTGKATSDRPFEARPLGEIEIAPNGQHFVPGFRGIFAFSAPKVDLLAGAERSLSAAAHTEFSDDGKWLVQVGSSGIGKAREYAATVVSTANWKVVCRVPTSAGGRAALSPDGTTLAVVTGDDVTFYDVATEKKFGGFRSPAGAWAGDRSRGVRVLRFTADGTKLITADIDTTALVWPVPARK